MIKPKTMLLLSGILFVTISLGGVAQQGTPITDIPVGQGEADIKENEIVAPATDWMDDTIEAREFPEEIRDSGIVEEKREAESRTETVKEGEEK